MIPCASDGSIRIARVFQRYSQGIVSSTESAPGYVERGNPSTDERAQMTVPHHGFGPAAQILHREQIVQKNRNLRLHDRAFHAGQAAAEIGEQLVIHALVSIAEVRHLRLQARDRKLRRKDILELANLCLEVIATLPRRR